MLRGFDHLMNLVLADVEEHYVVRLRTSRTKLRPAAGAAPADGMSCPHPNPMTLDINRFSVKLRAAAGAAPADGMPCSPPNPFTLACHW